MSSEEDQNQRLSKFLAYAGIASRRNSEKLILKGRVSVNGSIVIDPGTKVSTEDDIFCDGRAVSHELEKPRIWLYHKPVGEICSDFDPFGKRTVFESFPNTLGRVCLVGRLDYNSEGLLLLTNKGFIKRYLELPSNKIVRTYEVKVWGKVGDSNLEPIRSGITVGGVNYAPMIIDYIFKGKGNKWLKISITEGKNREIRKVLGKIGLKVSKLKRVSYGNFRLGKLKPGHVKEVGVAEDLRDV